MAGMPHCPAEDRELGEPTGPMPMQSAPRPRAVISILRRRFLWRGNGFGNRRNGRKCYNCASEICIEKALLINGDPLMQISWIMQQGKVTALARGPFPEP
jgi:hypothetical protein